MSWFFLMTAILLEITGTTCLKLSEGFTRLWPSLFVFPLYGLSFWSLGLALKRLEVGIAYAIWAGLGTALIALIGIAWFQESVSPIKLISLVLIIAGVIGLNLGGPPVKDAPLGHTPVAPGPLKAGLSWNGNCNRGSSSKLQIRGMSRGVERERTNDG